MAFTVVLGGGDDLPPSALFFRFGQAKSLRRQDTVIVRAETILNSLHSKTGSSERTGREDSFDCRNLVTFLPARDRHSETRFQICRAELNYGKQVVDTLCPQKGAP